MVFGQAQDRIPLCQVRKKQTMRGSRKWIDHAHVRLWTVVVVSLQIGIIGVMVLEGVKGNSCVFAPMQIL